jgi:hypothetical protein
VYTAPVREAAVVYLNGRPAGSLWSPPYELDISSLVSAGRNELRIVVGNTAMNQMAKSSPPDFKALTAQFGERFRLQDVEYIEALPSGLLGGVQLRVYADQ